jgi:hypothetical protein
VDAISRKERHPALSLCAKCGGMWLEVVTMEAADFDATARLCDASGAALRAGDSLHLAVELIQA